MFFDLIGVKIHKSMLLKFVPISLFALFFVACHKPIKPSDVAPLKIEVATVQVDTLPERRSFIGTLSSNYEAVVQPRVNGYLIAKLFDNGMPVRRGEAIFRIDPRELQANLLAAEANLASANAKLAESKNNYMRAKPLVEIDAISQAQFDQYRAEYKAAVAAVKSATQALKNARLERGYTNLYASIDGVISASSAHVGDYVGPATKFPTLTVIQNIDTVCVNVAIPMRDYLLFSGQKSLSYDNRDLLSDIRLYLADGQLYPMEGRYNYTKSAVADAMGTIIIVVSFPNPDYLLKTGQFARVETNIGKGGRRLLVPQSAVSQVQNINSVWIVHPDSTVEFRKVTLGATVDDMRIITDGIAQGERVATSGQLKLQNGMKITPQKE